MRFYSNVLFQFIKAPVILTAMSFIFLLSSVLESSRLVTFYETQQGDTLQGLAYRFDIDEKAIYPQEAFSENGLAVPGQKVFMLKPVVLNAITTANVMPNNETYYSAHVSQTFDLREYIDSTDGYLSTQFYDPRYVDVEDMIIAVAEENAISPKLLLSMLEYRAKLVTEKVTDKHLATYPFFYNEDGSRTYEQLSYAAQLILTGYYQWRDGRSRDIQFLDGTVHRVDPKLNPGTVAIIYFMANYHTYEEWVFLSQNEEGLYGTHVKMFGVPEQIEGVSDDPVVNPEQPFLYFPFDMSESWTFTGGPHFSWGKGSTWGAIDFAPAAPAPGCGELFKDQIQSMSDGNIVRLGDGVMVVELDDDQNEHTGWVLFYLHIKSHAYLKEGDKISAGDKLGYPSCSGGHSTGNHLHVARKYNGEWINAVYPTPFVLLDWETHSSGVEYEGFLDNKYFKIIASDKSVRISQVSVAVENLLFFVESLQAVNILIQTD